MFTRPSAASVMPVPDPVDPEVIVTFALAALYAACQVPNSGNSSVLPVSEIDFTLALAAGEDDGAVVDFEGELEPHAAARTVSGTRAAAVHTKRIFLATWEYSFSYARLRVRDRTRTRMRATVVRYRGPWRPCGRSAVLPRGWSVSAEAAAHVLSGLFFGRVLEHLLGLAVLYESALVEEDDPV